MKSSNFESFESRKRPEAYFSISHLVRAVRVQHHDGTTTEHIIATRGKDFNDKVRFQAIGGGAKLTEDGIKKLKDRYGGDIRFRDGEESDDARFYIQIPEEIIATPEASDEDQRECKKKQDAFVRDVLAPYAEEGGDAIETSVERELNEELKEAVPNLTEEDMRALQVEYVSAVSPMQWENPGSGRREDTAMYHRLFHLFDITMPEDVFEKIKQSDTVRILDGDDIGRVQQATEHGNAMTELRDGSVLAENIFPSQQLSQPQK